MPTQSCNGEIIICKSGITIGLTSVLGLVITQVHTSEVHNCCFPGMNLTNSIPSHRTVNSQLLTLKSHNSNFLVNLIIVFVFVDFKLWLINIAYGPKN
jgi:hypothetical protein